MSTPTFSGSTRAERWGVPTELDKLYDQAANIKLTTWENPLRLLVTGSRDWVDILVPTAVLLGLSATYGPIALLHGDARGLDRMAKSIALSTPNWPEPFGMPAVWKNGKDAGFRRNQGMVDLGNDICIGFPERSSRGTPDCLDRAITAGIPTFYVWNYVLKPWVQQKERKRFKN